MELFYGHPSLSGYKFQSASTCVGSTLYPYFSTFRSDITARELVEDLHFLLIYILSLRFYFNCISPFLFPLKFYFNVVCYFLKNTFQFTSVAFFSDNCPLFFNLEILNIITSFEAADLRVSVQQIESTGFCTLIYQQFWEGKRKSTLIFCSCKKKCVYQFISSVKDKGININIELTVIAVLSCTE